LADPRPSVIPTLGTVSKTHDWLETDPDDVEKPPTRLVRDWALFALILGLAVAEVAFVDDMIWRWLGVPVGLDLAFATLWRRTRPLTSVALAFGALMAIDLATTVADAESFFLYAGFAVLILVYSLFRWGTGRQAALGSLIAVAEWAVSVTTSSASPTDAILGLLVLLFPAALGASVRYRRIVRNQQFERVRLHERDALARELHDTVAHHVSAIAIQAQAGQVLANVGDVAGAGQSLSLIEKQATLSLTEMRSVVAALRRAGEASETSVARGIGDIQDLATPEGAPGPRVQVEMRGELDDLRPGVQAALFRVAQEAVTNVNLHATHAGRVAVSVVGAHDTIHLEVTDDGDRVALVGRPSGYGLAGMEERVTLLGGTFEAGPLPERGWTVQASIPRTGRPA
jgi:signal transduction histidine kinase